MVIPGAPSVLAPSSDALASSSFLLREIVEGDVFSDMMVMSSKCFAIFEFQSHLEVQISPPTSITHTVHIVTSLTTYPAKTATKRHRLEEREHKLSLIHI